MCSVGCGTGHALGPKGLLVRGVDECTEPASFLLRDCRPHRVDVLAGEGVVERGREGDSLGSHLGCRVQVCPTMPQGRARPGCPPSWAPALTWPGWAACDLGGVEAAVGCGGFVSGGGDRRVNRSLPSKTTTAARPWRATSALTSVPSVVKTAASVRLYRSMRSRSYSNLTVVPLGSKPVRYSVASGPRHSTGWLGYFVSGVSMFKRRIRSTCPSMSTSTVSPSMTRVTVAESGR